MHFIIEGKDFKIKTDKITVNFWQYATEYNDYDFEGINHKDVDPYELIYLCNDCDVDTIQLEEYDFYIKDYEETKKDGYIHIVSKLLPFEEVGDIAYTDYKIL